MSRSEARRRAAPHAWSLWRRVPSLARRRPVGGRRARPPRPPGAPLVPGAMSETPLASGHLLARRTPRPGRAPPSEKRRRDGAAAGARLHLGTMGVRGAARAPAEALSRAAGRRREADGRDAGGGRRRGSSRGARCAVAGEAAVGVPWWLAEFAHEAARRAPTEARRRAGGVVARHAKSEGKCGTPGNGDVSRHGRARSGRRRGGRRRRCDVGGYGAGDAAARAGASRNRRLRPRGKREARAMLFAAARDRGAKRGRSRWCGARSRLRRATSSSRSRNDEDRSTSSSRRRDDRRGRRRTAQVVEHPLGPPPRRSRARAAAARGGGAVPSIMKDRRSHSAACASHERRGARAPARGGGSARANRGAGARVRVSCAMAPRTHRSWRAGATASIVLTESINAADDLHRADRRRRVLRGVRAPAATSARRRERRRIAPACEPPKDRAFMRTACLRLVAAGARAAPSPPNDGDRPSRHQRARTRAAEALASEPMPLTPLRAHLPPPAARRRPRRAAPRQPPPVRRAPGDDDPPLAPHPDGCALGGARDGRAAARPPIIATSLLTRLARRLRRRRVAACNASDSCAGARGRRARRCPPTTSTRCRHRCSTSR